MVGTLNLYLDPSLSFTWREASVLASKAANHGVYHARNLRSWILRYLTKRKLPTHRYGHSQSLLEDEDLSQTIQLHLQAIAKSGYIRAEDIVDFLSTPQMQKQFPGKKLTISIHTARNWLHKLEWRYGKKKNGMYIDGHEREDVIAYRIEFLNCMKEYFTRMVIYDNEGNAILPSAFAVPGGCFRLILVTHDESTFYANDRWKAKWTHKDDKAVPEPKGEGQSLMISDFLTPEWGRLVDGEEEGRIVDMAIDIFEGKTKGQAMPKGPSEGWTHKKGGPNMRPGVLPDGNFQELYYPDDHPLMGGWFKGMEQIIRECGLWPANGLNAQCESFKCEEGCTDCCCRRLLFMQPDFVNQKSALEELVTRRGHICDFYPKFHCELNFIEQYWGAAKLRYWSSPHTKNIMEMEANVLTSLADIPLQQIRRYAGRSAKFMDAYIKGLNGAQAAWAARKYHGHRVLPENVMAQFDEAHNVSK
ncbi:hypothetical protein M422DRAFT_251574 [Sphaerobolus stellatus SS14]|uniref:Unplaced genomic scaffold SPHSTscaffold_39, whole genome shotgun sequence n=2 Tax=Sphaerobolus stellatus (strain SS14) TaxID=990650 RepID=A0A0C9W1X9_SPHS4|nr:hypothetical protein M422DRAFT_251574 [Sphaerobolus stellatus SS14]